MKHFLFYTLSLMASISLFGQQNSIQFPSDSNIVDVTEEPYNAVGDGVADDTNALQQAIFDVIGNGNSTQTVYLPNGTYLVSDTLGGYTDVTQSQVANRIKMMGESRDGVVIKLTDNLWNGGFGDRKPVVRFSLNDEVSGFNDAFDNYLHNLTISVGSGNKDAIGVDYIASNRGSIRNVKITSDDGQGFTGLLLVQDQQGPHQIADLEIEGFSRGISSSGSNFLISFSNITLRNQSVEGWRNESLTIGIENLTSDNSVVTFINRGDGMVALNGVSITGGPDSGPAILNEQDGDIYIDDSTYGGSGIHFRDTNQESVVEITESTIADYASSQTHSLFDPLPAHLDLPDATYTDFHSNDFNDWANVMDYGADWVGRIDDSDAIQAAIDSGKPIIYFPATGGPRGEYTIEKPIYIRGNVRKIYGFNNFLTARGDLFDSDDRPPAIIVEDNAVDTVILDGVVFSGGTRYVNWLHHNSPADLVIIDGGAPIINSPGAGSLFLEDTVLGYLHLRHPQKVYANQLNVEPFIGTKVWNNGGDLRINGFKSERNTQVFLTTNGGRTQVMGSSHLGQWQGSDNSPVFRTIDSTVTATFITKSQQGNSYEIVAIETQSGETRVAQSDEIRTNTARVSSSPLYTAGTHLSPTTEPRVYVFGNALKGSFPTTESWSGFDVYRSSNEGSLTVDMSYSSDPGLESIVSQLPTEITFTDGSYVESIELPAFDASDFNQDQTVRLTINDSASYEIGYPSEAWSVFLNPLEGNDFLNQTNPDSYFDPAYGITLSEDGRAFRWIDTQSTERRFGAKGRFAPNPRTPYWQADAFGNSPGLLFDGALWTIETDPLLSFTPFSERTFALQFKTGSDVSTRQVLWATGDGLNAMSVYLDDGQIYVSYKGVDVRRWGPVWVSAAVEANTAYALVAVSSEASDSVKLYLNGVLLDEGSGVKKIGAQFEDTDLGGNARGLAFHDATFNGLGHENLFYGYIGKIGVWNRSLSTAELSLLNNNFSVLSETDLWYGFSVDAQGFVNTGDGGWFNGWIWVEKDPWIWTYALNKYVYIPNESGWTYFPR